MFYCNILGTISKEIISKYKERRNGPNYKKQRSALDDLASLERMKKDDKLAKPNTDSEFEFSDIDTNISRHPVDYSSDSLGQGTRFAQRTGVFDIDFPASGKVSKVDAKHPKKSSKVEVSRQPNTGISHCELDMNPSASESDTNIQPSGIGRSNINYDSSEATSTNEEHPMPNVNMARGTYSRKKG